MEENLPTKPIVAEIIENAHDDSAIKDFEVARSNIHVVVDTVNEAIQNLSEIANQSQHPRAFEVLGKLADSAVAANKSLLEIQEKMKNMKKANEPTTKSTKTINNNLFVGTTAELQKLLQNMKEENNSDD